MLLLLFPPLIFYYLVRIGRNRSASFPLENIDSLEKRYRPNWSMFVAGIIAAYLIAGFCAFAVALTLEDRSKKPRQVELGFSEAFSPGGSRDATTADWLLPMGVRHTVLAIATIVMLASLLANRIIAIKVVSGNNDFSVLFSSGDVRGSEEEFDAFLQKVHVEIDRVRRR
jgi:hypothetical protein